MDLKTIIPVLFPTNDAIPKEDGILKKYIIHYNANNNCHCSIISLMMVCIVQCVHDELGDILKITVVLWHIFGAGARHICIPIIFNMYIFDIWKRFFFQNIPQFRLENPVWCIHRDNSLRNTTIGIRYYCRSKEKIHM